MTFCFSRIAGGMRHGFRKAAVLTMAAAALTVVTGLPGAALAGHDRHDSAGAPAADCEIGKGACSKKTGNGMVVLDIGPKPVKAMEELTFIVSLKGIKEPDKIRVDLKMPGMFMGDNRVALVKNGPGRYTGKGVIPRCHSGRTLWSAVVVLPGQKPVEIPFLFNVVY